MKNRSHRHPPDDWVEESWTVDCVCGVNFDDGEEMVNCDECGVWVHTRCSHYVKSEKSFACDKCKSKNNRNDSEETEVAQLLVELPTKTLRMDNPYPWNCPPRRPFRLWTDIPMEERVHVQGIPGGDPALFGGLTSIFTPELWKCTGYVPKKFNFQYKEFPCWDKKQESNHKNKEENENPADKGAGVLFSLSKENILTTPATTLIGIEKQTEECSHDRVPPLKDMKKWEGDNMNVRRPHSGAKERSLLRPFVIHSGKHEKEEICTYKDRNGKKKARIIDKEGDIKKKAVHGPKKGSAISSDAKPLEFYEDRVHKILKSEIENENLRDIVPDHRFSDGRALVGKDVDVRKNNTVCSSEALSSDICRHNISTGSKPKENKGSIQVSAMIESSKSSDDATSLLGHTDNGCVSIKEEIVGVAPDNVDDNGGSSSKTVGIYSHNSESLVESMATAAPKIEDKQNIQESSMDIMSSSLQPIVEVKTEVDIDKSGGVFDVASSSLIDKMDGTMPLVQHPEMSTDHLSENVRVRDKAVSNLQYNDHKMQDIDRSTEAISDCQTDKADEQPADPCQVKQQSEASEGSVFVRKCSSSLKHASIPAEEPSKSNGSILSPAAPPSQRKVIVSVGKAPSTSSSIVISKHAFSDNRRPADTPGHDLITKQKGISDSNISAKKDSTDITRVEDGHEMPKKISKEHHKSSVSCVLKASHSTKISHNSFSKRSSLDSKDLMRYSSSKASSAQNVAVSPVLGESASSLQTQSASHVQNKITASGLSQRIEKVNQSSHQSSKMNSMPSMHPPVSSNSTTALSDEELALLLHQELNSSPRVPRVPRMRHAGSLPQLTSPTTTSMLVKRTSSSGGKDHNSAPKKKTKDMAKDGSCSSHDISGEAKKMDRVSASYQIHDSVCTIAPFTIGEADDESAKGIQSIKKSTRRFSIGTASGGLSSSTEANEQNFSFVQKSPRNASDDDAGTIGGPTHHHTLPGLIAEIMNKGKRMTYEELCNAVLPHWPNLRKHNGERYAYSSHSQAVLDCLRNRHEWARLVDRGPKTSTSRKRRKLDAEPPSFESDDSEYRKDRSANAVESKNFKPHREEFPKGKRKARKRRRLSLQERGIKDVRRSKEDVLSDDDIISFSSSSEESMFSEDEVLEGGTSPVGSEASASSDEMGTMS